MNNLSVIKLNDSHAITQLNENEVPYCDHISHRLFYTFLNSVHLDSEFSQIIEYNAMITANYCHSSLLSTAIKAMIEH